MPHCVLSLGQRPSVCSTAVCEQQNDFRFKCQCVYRRLPLLSYTSDILILSDTTEGHCMTDNPDFTCESK